MIEPAGCACAHGSDPVSRRSVLTASMSAMIGGALLTASACSATEQSPQPARAPQPQASPALPENALITLGTVAGPPPLPNKTGISSALKLGDDVYQIDCGLGSLNAFATAGLKFDDIQAMFITHLHTDHIVDYGSFLMSGGYTASKNKAPVIVYGPGPAGGLPPSQLGDANPATIDPQDPTPGLATTTAMLQKAFAYTNNIFIRDMGTDDIDKLFIVSEIAVPPGSDYRNRAPKTDPFPVMADDNVVVTATLVAHYDVYPAFAFRFDMTKLGLSVTFSGDTTKSDNLITLARDTDILVHESMFSLEDAYYGNRFPPNYLINSHTSAEQVGEVAAAAGAKQVLLSHYQPPDLPDSEWQDAVGKNYSGPLTVARDGQVFTL